MRRSLGPARAAQNLAVYTADSFHMGTEGELRAALILAGRRIVKLNFGRRDDPVLGILRRVLREARASRR